MNELRLFSRHELFAFALAHIPGNYLRSLSGYLVKCHTCAARAHLLQVNHSNGAFIYASSVALVPQRTPIQTVSQFIHSSFHLECLLSAKRNFNRKRVDNKILSFQFPSSLVLSYFWEKSHSKAVNNNGELENLLGCKLSRSEREIELCTKEFLEC